MDRRKIVLIEDDETMLSLVGILLEMEGYQVIRLSREEGLEETLDSIRRERPDLALADVNLSQFNGLELLKCIRQDPELKGTRVLMSSGMDLGMRCYEEGADGFILKPYMPEELIGKIRQALDK
jgi:DNA-binding response OmpR family regulator